MSKKRNGIPDRWLDYKSVGRKLPGTRFIAFKVPLKQALNRQLQSSEVFGLWELLESVQKQRLDLGLIIDLTFTTRYYSIQDVPESLLFVKIFTAGHEVPGDDTILSFKRAVRTFLRENANNEKLVGVHCTHGLNRTGYLICRYLIDVDGMDPKEAVDLFNSSRGHAVERQNYLQDLQRGPKRSNDGMDESEQEPIRGLASHRPSDIISESREERWPPSRESHQHRYFPPRATSHRSHPQNGLLPNPQPHGEHFNQYRRTAPPPEDQWRRPRFSPPRQDRRFSPPRADRRSRCPPPAPPLQVDRRRAPPPLQVDRRRAPPPPPGDRRRAPPPLQEDRRRAPPPLQVDRRRAPPPPPGGQTQSSPPPPGGQTQSSPPPPGGQTQSSPLPPSLLCKLD
ncbi:RNA/RNP complex-1-interacting phosphatase [Trematomus bernacchii]|uniref:RNA/RNP complex-1-interacting phosphatase n=1 Tax=Trematomus bernacchii TaxID=40690 RepID=UPI00146B422B|nr:RNA/RNP complex-1-interacting phosphatase [Trematomus bernacchii]